MPNPSQGKCVLNATLKEKYPFLETTKSNFSVASGGNADIMRHLKTKKHIDLWSGPIMELKIYSWEMLRKAPVWKDVEIMLNKLNDLKLYNAVENSSKVHKEFGYVKTYCSDAKIKHRKDENFPISKRWIELFTHLETENCVSVLHAVNTTVENYFSCHLMQFRHITQFVISQSTIF